MAARAAPAALALALALALAGPAAAGPLVCVLVVESGGAALARLPLGAGGLFCLHWRHSVTGGPVADCFGVAPNGGLMLAVSFLHDYAAGLGDIPGRGRVEAAPGGGYRIVEINEPLPGGVLRLRVGAARVGHRLTSAAGALDLSALAPGQRVTLRLAAEAP